MTSFTLAALCVGFALASVGCAHAPATHPGMKMSASDQAMMSSCMSMSHEVMMKDTGCSSMMAKMKMSESDMQEMMACHKMPHDAMIKDEHCMSMMKMHSGMVKAGAPS